MLLVLHVVLSLHIANFIMLYAACDTLNFIGELFSIISLLNIDYSLIGLFLFNVLLTTCYSFFNMSIILLEQEVHKDTNRIEFILIIIGYNLIFIHLK